ncbi:MAG: hypothetical protein CL566_11090 [Alphaproteobacteria bacterium]|nr:hypothetical protein [Alphaproteobacteria bacterium]|tara:strand:+ start:1851 stop:2096 length:246 start_codon:yes stop_codon:yes gene_type:complete
MALLDCRAVPGSSDNRSSLDRYETALTLLNGYFLDPLEEIDAALADDPGFVMGHCLRGGRHPARDHGTRGRRGRDQCHDDP